MSHAWLDSLTEDWVSQPSSSPPPVLPSPAQLSLVKSTKKSEASPSPKITPSRIPRWRHPGAVVQSPQDKSMTILEGDRSPESGKSPKKRLLKFVNERKPSDKRLLGRSVSSVTTGSVVHKVQHRAPVTPGKSDTPEWKRRLVYGKLQYGEQRDLFSSAAVGLQDMFKPPPSSEADVESPSPNFDSPSPNPDYPSPNIDFSSPKLDPQSPSPELPTLESPSTADLYETDMPSSPPKPKEPTINIESEEDVNAEEEGGIFSDQITPSPSPRRPLREIKYKLNVEEDAADISIMSNDDSPIKSPAPSKETNKENVQDDSYLAIPSLIDGVSRKTSGHSYTRNEDFSPILIGRHSDEDGKVEFTPLEMPADELRERLERLQLNQMILDPSHNASDSAVDAKPAKVEVTFDFSQEYDFDTSHGSNCSAEGSLRHHSLSPDLGVDWSEMLPEESLQASTPKQFPSLRTRLTDSNLAESNLGNSFLGSPDVPKAPFPSPDKRQIRDPGSSQSNSSPLKLFGPYDTFTNQTLLRRISQFEEGMSGKNSPGSSGENSRSSSPFTPSHDPGKKQFDRTPASKRYVSHFGAGELEGFEFTNDLSHSPAEHSSLLFKENISPKPPLAAAKGALKLVPPQSWLHEDASLHVRRSRSKSYTPSATTGAGYDFMSSSPENSASPGDEAYDESWAAKRDYGSEAKRPRTSPIKHPTPKRRRTLHRSDIAFGNENWKAIGSSHHEKLLRGFAKHRRRSLSEYSDSADAHDGEQMSVRQSHSSAPTSRSSQDDVFQGKLRRSQTRSVQEDGQPNNAGDSERKPSIRTQDFVDQAAQIMAMIRNQVSQPGLTSLEESELEIGLPTHNATMEESDGSTAEPFSRPPSRDGKPIPRRSRQQEDPEVVKRLKKYQELSDMGDIISSSVRSMGLAKDAIRAAKEVERMVDQASSRARTSGGGGGSNVGSASESTSPVNDLFSSSSARSTSHMFPTSSSRGSESRKIIAPESVSHLIPDKIGGMYLDKQNNIWIRNKESKSSATSHNTGSDDSEEDPFANIPDLTVDMTEEMQHLKRTPRGGREGVMTNKSDSSRQSSAQTHSLKSYTTLAAYEPLDPEVAARARGEIEKLDAQPGDGHKITEETGSRLPVLKAKTSSDGLSSKRRNITISFTSPIASIILGVLPEDIEGLEDDPVPDGSSGSPQLQQTAQFSGPKGVANGSLRGIRAVSINATNSGSRFTPRPVSRIDEQDEESTVELPNQNKNQNQGQNERQLSFIGDNTLMSLKSLEGGPGFGFLVNQTPAHHAVSLRADDSLLIGRNVGKLSLSPLSEFTMNNADRSFGLEVSYVMGHKRMATGDGSKKVLSMTIRDLVEKLSEAEPHEPYWEDMTSLTLQDKQLTSLHMLNEFCSKLTTLDVSKNSLGHLDGVPEGVRQLKVSNNMLTELTSWDHLIHLQYLDISNNEVKSLSALKRLIHLRSLKADNNLLTSLDGLDSHDGLLTLRARNNLIEELDFSGIKWERLAELDVSSNRISSVQGLHLLPALSQLNISDNHLQTLAFDKANRTLRKLDISDNDLESLDIRYLGNLQTLHADRNCISHISGFRYVRRMDSLSLREQRGEAPLELDFLTSACEIRKLFLSGNYLGTFTLKADFLNLQLLELANCGLEELPDECGQLMPNLRTLNLNFNAIRDLSSLRFIPRLKKLLAAGNRLSDTIAVTELLTDFPHLTELDLRDNPITQGFYPPVQMLISADKIGSADSFVMPDADVERDESFTRRRDETTRLRRRLHEVVYVASCKRLRKLDGLSINREKILAKDALLQRLVDDGLVPELEETLVAESELAQQRRDVASPPLNITREPANEESGAEMNHSRWNAEDSFA
ncbi:hypothetical protein TARUN_1800 [Trichoderma arundinaceum]|uniref:Septation initiation network scaffold protein cdc11 n=1 Tax=Trichoderma arundinaceum TaxID=490622 RepID=A0A395NY52_TRIAR|nr:hypothetical protein TARUN_1800 [Trichoderma arundinaceum]